ncbi:MAG: peptidase C45 [Chloroflexaceae bacterium]|nr:peptidase C45 [Chloroflexaceae bacterium]
MFPHIRISGTPYERGRQYGQQAIPQIQRSIASYAMLFAHDRGIDWQQAQQVAGDYIDVLDVQAPAMLAEMRGIADGAGYTLAAIVALNARTELLAGYGVTGMHPDGAAALERNRAAGLPQIPARTECTALAVLPEATANGEMFLAQTWDWIRSQRAACVVLRVQSNDHPDVITLTEGGMVGKIGLNRAGLGVCLNILSSYDDGQTPQLPIHVLLRLLLEQDSYTSARHLLDAVRGGASSNITLGTAEGRAVCYEITPGATRAIEPQDGLLVHTNHCLLPATHANERPIPAESSTRPRYNRATELLAELRGQVTAPRLMEVLRDQQGAPLCICRTADESLHPADQSETVAAVVLDLPQRVMHLAPDRPCATDFVPIALA